MNFLQVFRGVRNVSAIATIAYKKIIIKNTGHSYPPKRATDFVEVAAAVVVVVGGDVGGGGGGGRCDW